jgi:hypothetical protein
LEEVEVATKEKAQEDPVWEELVEHKRRKLWVV